MSRKFCIFETIIAHCLLFCLYIFQEFGCGAAGGNVPGPGHSQGAEVAFPEGTGADGKGSAGEQKPGEDGDAKSLLYHLQGGEILVELVADPGTL